jgi:hypothetical protein
MTEVSQVKQEKRPVGKVRAYFCGGAAIDIGARHYLGASLSVGMGELHSSFIDTTRSNIASFTIPTNSVYVVPGAKEGSGKKRDENYEAVMAALENMVTAQPPLDFNIVVASGGGGSGNVIQHCLYNWLVANGHTAIMVFIACTDSEIAARNSMRSLQSLENEFADADADFRMIYVHNEKGETFAKADAAVIEAINCLLFIASNQNDGLDQSDLQYFINTSKPLRSEPSFGIVKFRQDNDFGDIKYADAVLTIYATAEREPLKIDTGYDTFGRYPFPMEDGFKSLHALISNNGLGEVFDRLAKVNEHYETQRTSRVGNRSIVSDDKKAVKVGKGGFMI